VLAYIIFTEKTLHILLRKVRDYKKAKEHVFEYFEFMKNK
jgi:hypothetical protein